MIEVQLTVAYGGNMYKIKEIMKKITLGLLFFSTIVVDARSKSSTKLEELTDAKTQELLQKIEPALAKSKDMIEEFKFDDDFKVDVLSKQEADLINFFYRPINFDQNGINYYFKYVYNHPEYANYLPYNFSHMIQFLEYGTRTDQTEAFAASIIKLFMQKMKATPCIDAESFVEFMPRFAQAIKPYLEKKEASFLQDVQVVLKDRLTSIFSKYFSYFQKDPDGFMTDLSKQIAKQTNQHFTAQHVEVEQLKKDILRFIELCANKLVWSSKDDMHVWTVCNKLAYEAHQCLESKVLPNQDALDDVCWSVIHRFCYFLDLAGNTLSSDFYDRTLEDLKTKPLILTALAEQEDLMTTKREHLVNKLQDSKKLSLQKPVSIPSMQFDESSFEQALKTM